MSSLDKKGFPTSASAASTSSGLTAAIAPTRPTLEISPEQGSHFDDALKSIKSAFEHFACGGQGNLDILFDSAKATALIEAAGSNMFDYDHLDTYSVVEDAPLSPIELCHKFKLTRVELILSASANARAPLSLIVFLCRSKVVRVELTMIASANA
ncbi:hypothetical protein BGZ81_011722 [Podila clonocystis]|nr:hypothetical protein BGZ81_011722 [Podila clonocystis]